MASPLHRHAILPLQTEDLARIRELADPSQLTAAFGSTDMADILYVALRSIKVPPATLANLLTRSVISGISIDHRLVGLILEKLGEVRHEEGGEEAMESARSLGIIPSVSFVEPVYSPLPRDVHAHPQRRVVAAARSHSLGALPGLGGDTERGALIMSVSGNGHLGRRTHLPVPGAREGAPYL